MLDITSKNYGHDKIIKKVSGIPNWLPVNATIQHGWYVSGMEAWDLRKNPDLLLVWNERVKKLCENAATSTRIETIGSPFVLYRIAKEIIPSFGAKGTVAFPQHSTRNNEALFSIEKYSQDLLSLDSEFHPISICLHYIDYPAQKDFWLNKGFNVVSAGPSKQAGTGFVDRFYSILSSHRYSTSNDVGSYAFYAIEMGVPFFLHGDKPEFNFNDGRSLKLSQMQVDWSEAVNKIFSVSPGIITKEQIDFVNSEVGKGARLTQSALRNILLHGAVSRFFKTLYKRWH